MAQQNGSSPAAAETANGARKIVGIGERRKSSKPNPTPSQVYSLAWRRDGDGWLLLAGRRKFGRVERDQKYSGMWRVQWSDGRLSDLTNLTRAKDALSRFAESESRRLRSGAEEGFRRPLVRQIRRGAA